MKEQFCTLVELAGPLTVATMAHWMHLSWPLLACKARTFRQAIELLLHEYRHFRLACKTKFQRLHRRGAGILTGHREQLRCFCVVPSSFP